MRAIDLNRGTLGGVNWRRLMWAVIALLLIGPLIAMQFTREMAWDAADFAMAGALLVGGALVIEVAARSTRNQKLLASIAVLVVGTIATIWADAAVGVFQAGLTPPPSLLPRWR